MPFYNTLGLWALLALIPFIILYLIRPKTIEKIIPSLMFLIKEKKETKQAAFLKKLLQNLLFIVQLIALAALAFAVASPYINLPYNLVAAHTVVVLDASASMQAKYDSKTRFEQAIETAKNNLDGKISIILAESSPVILLKKGSKQEADTILTTLNPRATTTNIGDAIIAAADLLEGQKGRIIVISDFIQTEGQDILVAKRALVSRGSIVDFIDIYSEAQNIGIIDLIIDKYQTKAYIKNYKDEKTFIRAKLISQENVLSEKTLEILPKSVESIVFDTPLGLSNIDLDIKDDFKVDNIAYISSPLKKKITALIITNNKENNFIKSAFEASKEIEVEIAEPPVVPELNHDIVVFSNVNKDLLLPGTFNDISRYVDKGGIAIIAAQINLNEFETEDILPINLKTISNKSAPLCIDIFNQFTKQFENDHCFTNLAKFFEADAQDNTAIIASANNYPVLVLKDKKKGKIFYYGIIDEKSDFKTLPSYPIFWNRLISFLMETEDIRLYNYKTGDIKIIDEQEVKTPTGTVKTSKLLLDEAGIYEFNNKKIAANLIDEKESNLNRDSKILEQDKKEFGIGNGKSKKRINLDIPLLVFVVLLLIFEIMYIKTRGDL